jgi:hypothetical protein
VTTLGGFTPLVPLTLIPTTNQTWWKPCLTRADGTTDTHVWFLEQTKGSLYCPACRWNRPRVVIGPKDWIADINDALDQGDMRQVRELLAGRETPAELAAPVIAPWKPKDKVDWMEFFKERAAMFEFLGGMKRPEAEAAARELAGECP